MKLYEKRRKEALKKRHPVRYYIFSMSLGKRPEDFELYKKGFEQHHCFKISNKDLEKLLKKEFPKRLQK